MKWIQSDYDKEHGIERYFLRPNDSDSEEDWYESLERYEWVGSVTRCSSLPGTPILRGDPRDYVAIIEPEDQNKFEDSYDAYFPALKDAKRWVELEMSLDRKL